MSRRKLYLLELPTQALKSNVLPTKRDVLLAIQYEKLTNNKGYREAKIDVQADVLSIWEKASLPVVSERQIKREIDQLHGDYLKLLGADKTRRCKDSFKKKAEMFTVCCSP